MRISIDAGLSRWSSEFLDREVEAAFREWNHPAALSLARTVGYVIVVAALPYLYATFLRFGDAPTFHLLLVARLAIVALGCLLLFLVHRRVGAGRLDLVIAVVIVAVQVQSILLAALSVPAINLLDVQVILVLVCIYAFMPTRFVFKLVACLAMTLAFLALVIAAFDIDPPERFGLIAWLIGANIIGIYTCRYWDRLRRSEYTTQERLRLANEALAASNRDLARARADAERESQTKSQFLANVSHELRTPLNAIIGFSEIMKAGIYGPLGDRRYDGYLDDIHGSGTYLLNLINDLLDLAKVEAGKLELHESEVDIAATIGDATRMLAEDARRRGVAIATRIAGDLPPLMADARACRQILLNLLSNAVKFSPSGREVTVAARVEPTGDLLLAVSDAGPGIAPEDLAKVVEPFGQAAMTTVDAKRGTGLGLPLAISLAKAHGGSLELRSTPGGGTTVDVRFPAGRLLPPGTAATATDRS
ncbi:sensor histidine kinase [Marinibaculum pumilum]|uniref:histidine kinase n=1 Tax=Marinibaculum pumilum TaxID=1766165 RepID=A0ABV7L435_9PROT